MNYCKVFFMNCSLEQNRISKNFQQVFFSERLQKDSYINETNILLKIVRYSSRFLSHLQLRIFPNKSLLFLAFLRRNLDDIFTTITYLLLQSVQQLYLLKFIRFFLIICSLEAILAIYFRGNIKLNILTVFKRFFLFFC